jgi:hypothetical protein
MYCVTALTAALETSIPIVAALGNTGFSTLELSPILRL